MSGVQVPTGASDSSAVVLAPPQQQQHLQEVTVVTQLSPEAADGISEVVLTPPQQQQHQGQEVTVTQFSPEAVDEIIRRYKAFARTETDHLEDMRGRGWFMMLATVTASITYSAALNPPGGFWQDDKNGHVPGNPVLSDINRDRYNNFCSYNFISFLSSLIIIAFLSVPNILNMSRLEVCYILFGIDVLSLMVAFIAGHARSRNDYVHEGLTLVGVFVGIIVARRVCSSSVARRIEGCIRSKLSQ